MSRITDYVLDQEESGELVYVEGEGYVTTDKYAHKFMQTKAFEKEFDKAFVKEKEEVC